MLIKLGNFEFTEVWDGVLYKKLSQYPAVSPWEMRNLIEFVEYEASHGRECQIECENANVLAEINHALDDREAYRNVTRPALITECTACPVRKGCATEFVCHTTSIENAQKILSCGSILSARKARNLPVELLMAEARNAANDPADYFEYVMLAWGNCQAGDRLVMERKLGSFPDDKDLSVDFTPGVRFYFRYDDLVKHPGRVFDGVLPMKIKDGIVLNDWLYALVIPKGVELDIPPALKHRAIYVENDCRDIWEWSEKVYRLIEHRAEAGITARRFMPSDAPEVSALITHTLRTTNIQDYSPEHIEKDVAQFTPEKVLERAGWTHFYVFLNGARIVGCGAIGPYWGSETESSLFNIFVLPTYQGKGVGRRIIETLEADPYALRAKRIEIPASITACAFYQKMGYTFKNGVAAVDDEQLYRLEKLL